MLIDWRDIPGKVVVALLTALILGALALVWNWGSSGGLVRALGGVTLKELTEEVAKHPGPVGPPGAPGVSAEIPDGAVVAFVGQPGGCPKGWSLEDDAVGSAIVGVGANLIGETGLPLQGTDLGNIDVTPKKRAGFITNGSPEEKNPGRLYGSGGTLTLEKYSQPISPFVYGVKTAMIPKFFAALLL